jgi:FkbM family methyltransferase
MAYISNKVKGLLRHVGVDIHRYQPSASTSAQTVTAMRHFEIDLVLDIGANVGQFAMDIRQGGYRGEIVSFEPLPDAYPRLQANSSKDDCWTIHPRCAIGDSTGEVEINVAANLASSSILPMLETHVASAPHSAYNGKQTVPLVRLDDVVQEYLHSATRPFLKIDTQGYEWHVLNGATSTIDRCKGVLVEMSLADLYDGQPDWKKMISRLEDKGFQLWALQPEFTNQNDGRTLQMDGIFFRVD